jgi:hypothetical protein
MKTGFFTFGFLAVAVFSFPACKGCSNEGPPAPDGDTGDIKGERDGSTAGVESTVGADADGPEEELVLFAWNNLGMHCLNPSYDEAVILPPYNTLYAQVVRRGNPPRIVTDNLTLHYEIQNNTFSYGKRDYGGFWDNADALFGVSLERDRGLNLRDPTLQNGLSGTMELSQERDHFEAEGIPITPVDDSGAWNPYQVAVLRLKNDAGENVASTRTVVPTSDEIHCSRCHGNEAFTDILKKHDAAVGSALENQKPVLCAKCHGSPALGRNLPGTSGQYLSQAIHTFHSDKGAACYDCHPGPTTQCNRSLAHTNSSGKCTACHGGMAGVGNSIAEGRRTPWVNEPACATCHSGVEEVGTGTALYQNALGHGNLYCAACHGSPHAMIPSRQGADHLQAQQYQKKSVVIGSCRACHSNSRGGGENGNLNSFAEIHGGEKPLVKTACNVCHTVTPVRTSHWPHAFQWKYRN